MALTYSRKSLILRSAKCKEGLFAAPENPFSAAC